MEELIKKLELNNNVKKLTYEKSTGLWCIQYNNGYNPDQVTSDELLLALTEDEDRDI